MTILIAGIDGYIGWPLAMHLAKNGEKVVGIDKFLRRQWVKEMGGNSAMPIKQMNERLKVFKNHFSKDISFYEGDLLDYKFVEKVFEEHKPHTIVHLGEQPSAPYSMIDVDHATFTQRNNIIGTLNILFAMHKKAQNCHLVKLGTMGEYGTPNMDIPEGFFEVEYKGRKDKLSFPKSGGSWYHWTKVHDSGNVMFACKIWNLRSTDIMQGVVYGTRTEEMINEDLFTRFDYDGVFGTAINRYCAQAVIGHKLTPYGVGHQKRGFIALRDSINCLTLAIRNPPEMEGYRVFNQFDEVYDVTELAKMVAEEGSRLSLNTEINNIENPRIEAEQHYYNPECEKLKELGFKPKHPIKEEISIVLRDLIKYKGRINPSVISPKVRWKD